MYASGSSSNFQQMLMCLFISTFEVYIYVKSISADFAESANLSYASCIEKTWRIHVN